MDTVLKIEILAKAMNLPPDHPAVVAGFKAATKEIEERARLSFLDKLVPEIREKLGTGWIAIGPDFHSWKPGSPKKPGESGESGESTGKRGLFGDKQKDWIRDRIREGFANASIARAIKCSEGTIQGLRKRMNPVVKAKKPGNEDIPADVVLTFPKGEG